MRQLEIHIKNRNTLLSSDLHPIQEELQNCFKKNLLRAGVLQPGYFSDFFPILEKYKTSKVIEKYMVSEEEYTDSGNFYKIPVIDVTIDSYNNQRIFLSPF